MRPHSFHSVRMFLLAGILLLSGGFPLFAQQYISVSVQVNRRPDGHYPTKIYQFSSTPGLVTITLTNLTNNPQNIYLTGKLTGDNGVLVATSKNYQPPSTLQLGALARKTLNAIEASYLFDANNLTYISGNTSIKPSVFGEQGLPEGTYQLCIRAVDAASRQPLSDEEPIGCSNLFQVSLLEPPLILNPFEEQELPDMGIQNIPLRWTTPPGAAPSTEYHLRIVEIYGQQNPNEAMFASPTPFFETIVKGTPLFLYSVQQPQMQKGRSYAMMVVASDPFGNSSFRNKGQSEIVEFTYGSKNILNQEISQNSSEAFSTEYADHKISGHLSWAFKKSEKGSFTISTGSGLELHKNEPLLAPGAEKKNVAISARALVASPYLTATISPNAYALQTAVTPMIGLNAIAAINADPSLQTHTSGTIYQKNNDKPGSPEATPPSGFVSASGAVTISITYENIVEDTATERFPLPGVSLMLHGYPGAGQPILLGTGKTDKDGNFTLEFLDPTYASAKNVTRLTLTATTTDFENTIINIPLEVLNKVEANIGNHTLIAKTLRIFPKIQLDPVLPVEDNGYEFHLYREARDLEDRPWLAKEGMTGEGTNLPGKLTGGRIEIANGVIPAHSEDSTANFRSVIKETLLGKGAGRIFFGGNIYVSVKPASADYYDRNSVVNIVNIPLSSAKVVLANIEYRFTHQPSHISGSVSLPLGEKGKVPVERALVRVMYKIKDRAPGIDYNDFLKTSVKAINTARAIINSSSPGNGTATPTWTNANVHDPGITTLQALVYSINNTGLTTPVLLEGPVNGSGNNQLTAKATLDPLVALIESSTVPDDMRAVTSTVDELGNYYITLPPLVDRAFITVEVIRTPADFRQFAIEAKGEGKPTADFQLGKGASKIVDFEIKGDIAEVVARVVDDQGNPLQNTTINFKGNTIASTGPQGIFTALIYPGTHSFVLEKEGYVVKTITVHVPQLTNKKEKEYGEKWLKLTEQERKAATLARVKESPTVKASIQKGSIFSAAMFGIAAPDTTSSNGPGTSMNNSLTSAFLNAGLSSASQYEIPREFSIDLKDVGYLPKIVGKARFRIVDEDSNSPLAGVSLSLFDSAHKTDEKGEWYYEGYGGSATLTMIPPVGSAYISEQKLITLAESGKEELIIVKMSKGVLISGFVTGAGNPLPGARILLDDQDFSGISTDATGHYQLYTNIGIHKIGARKTGFVGAEKSAVDTKLITSVNFELAGGDNKRNYSTLLGFDIELDEAIPAGTGKEKWSGNFVKFQSTDPQTFQLGIEKRIPFSNLIVSFDARGVPLPQGNLVNTDLTELPFKLFGYLPVKLTTGDVLSFTGIAGGKGELNGKINIALNAIQGYRGWVINENMQIMLAHSGSAAADKFTVLSSEDQHATDQAFILIPETGNSVKAKLYGFTVNLNNGKADKEGLSFSGTVLTPEMPPIKSISFGIESVNINKALRVSGVIINQEQKPDLEIAGWKAGIEGLIFNEDGFMLGGHMNLNLAKSTGSFLEFSNLSISKDQVFGGKFNLPERGINVLALADLKADGAPLSFGRIGNSTVYRVAGKAIFKINVSILDKPFKVPSFEVLTNGDFSVQVPVNYRVPIKLFDFSISNLIINAKANTPSIIVQGNFKADLPFISFDVADMIIKAGSSGPEFSLAEVGIKLEVPILTTSARVKFSEEGFQGNGELTISGAEVLGGNVLFKYFKRSSGIELGAKFFANIPPIPLGPYFTLDGVGGGFDYRPGPLASNGGFEVEIAAKISVLGAGGIAAATVNPLTLKVESAGILTGSGDVLMANIIKTSSAVVQFNGPEKTFSIEINTTASPLEGLVNEKVFGTLVICAKKGDEFVFLGCGYQTKLLGLIDNRGDLAIALHLKNPKGRNDLIARYFDNAPEDYLAERFSGIYISVQASLGVRKEDAIGVDFGVASAKLWFAYAYSGNLLLNFEENAYRLKLMGTVELGGEACAAKIACAGLSAGICLQAEGGYNSVQGWNFAAFACGGIEFHMELNCREAGCNAVDGPWDCGSLGGAAKFCGTASVRIDFKNGNLGFDAGLGGELTSCPK